MRNTRYCIALGLALLPLALTQGEDKSTEATTDQQFVLKASAGGLAEVNMGRLAAKSASDPAVKKFGQHMVKDHDKANKELIDLANKQKFSVAARMDAEHQKLFDKLSKTTGAAFDREYMAGQVKDHEETVALFEKQAKNGKVSELKKWAEKTLPTLREHLKMAKEIQGNLKGSKTTPDK